LSASSSPFSSKIVWSFCWNEYWLGVPCWILCTESGEVSLKHNFQTGRGYFYCEQLALRIVESSAEPKGQGGQVSGRSSNNQEPARCLPPPLIRLLDIMVDLAPTGSRASGISLAGIRGKAGKPSPSAKFVSLSCRHFPPLLEVTGSGVWMRQS